MGRGVAGWDKVGPVGRGVVGCGRVGQVSRGVAGWCTWIPNRVVTLGTG